MTHLSPGYWATTGHFVCGEGRECVMKDEVPVPVSSEKICEESE